ncbi:MAG: glycoside hydrolase, partial [Terracidiphilus sp.]
VKLARDCDSSFRPYFNARTLTTGAEVSSWIWQQYLATSDLKFLTDNYSVIAASARFLVAYQKPGSDGMLHTSPSNAHETQWDVSDPTTDIAAAMTLYPITIQAAKLVGQDADLVKKLQDALPKIPPFPRTQLNGPFTLLPPSADAEGADMIAESYLPGAQNHNEENIGLEPVWPYDIISDTSPLFDLAKRTYQHRPSKRGGGWSFDPIQAARLGMGDEVGAALLRSTESSARCINGFTGCGRRGKGAGTAADPPANDRSVEFYVEQSGVAADALQEALVQDYDGLIRIAPAVPTAWDFDGSVFVRGKTKVDVQVRHGVPATVVIESGIAQPIKLSNPWPGEVVDVFAGKTKIVDAAPGNEIAFRASAGVNYLVERRDMPTADQKVQVITGTAATAPKKLGPVQLGLFRDAD